MLKKVTLLLVFVLFPLFATASDSDRFAFDIYSRIALQPDNIIFSPYSIRTALSMAAAGADGNTRAEMNKALRLNGSPWLEIDAKGRRGLTLYTANSLWIEKTYTVLPSYRGSVVNDFNSEVFYSDFIGSSEKERLRINGWIEKKTNARIKNLIPGGVLDSNTRGVLANAIYFLGKWSTAFRKSSTASAAFYSGSGQTAVVPTMFRSGRELYYENRDIQALKLKYNGDCSIMVLLPRSKKGIGSLERSLNSKRYDSIKNEFSEHKVDIYLPRWTAETSIGLNEVLKSIGIRDAFSVTKADFSGISGRRDLYISAVVHKAFCETSEAGTEAAAATAVVMTQKCEVIPEQAKIFRADHPFVYIISDDKSGEIIFIGRVEKP